MKNIFIIDSYPNSNHIYLKNRNLLLFTFNENNQMWEMHSDGSVNNPHGTAIGGIISKNIEDKNQRLIFFNIYSNEEDKMLKLLIKSLTFIKENYKSGIINCSMGTIYFDSELESKIKSLSNDFIIVSAFDNAGAVSYPAAFKEVIGVDTSYRCVKKDDFVVVENCIIDIKAKGGLQRVPWDKPNFTLNQGSSFACAYVTAFIVNNFYGMNKETILKEFKKISKFIYSFNEDQEKEKKLHITMLALYHLTKK